MRGEVDYGVSPLGAKWWLWINRCVVRWEGWRGVLHCWRLGWMEWHDTQIERGPTVWLGSSLSHTLFFCHLPSQVASRLSRIVPFMETLVSLDSMAFGQPPWAE